MWSWLAILAGDFGCGVLAIAGDLLVIFQPFPDRCEVCGFRDPTAASAAATTTQPLNFLSS